MDVYDASVRYSTDFPLIVVAGKDYGSGSSRDWAAKGPGLNLMFCCVLSLQFYFYYIVIFHISSTQRPSNHSRIIRAYSSIKFGGYGNLAAPVRRW